MGKLKGSRKKEKFIGTIAGVTAIAAPLMMVPGPHSYALINKDVEAIDAIQTIVLPLHGKKYIDLNLLYQTWGLEVNSTDTNATGLFTYQGNGIYEITANSIGSATFTVIGHNEGENGGDVEVDNFKVIVVENNDDPDNYKFDVYNINKLLNQSIYSKEQVTDLLKNISPISVNNSDPFSYKNGNIPPYQIYPSSSYISGKLGVPLDINEIRDEIYNYFDDYDGYIPEGSEQSPSDLIGLVSVESNADFSVSVQKEGNRIINYTITPLHDGDVNLDVVVTDHHGGFTKGHIPIHIDRVFNSTSVLAKHFLSPELNNPVLYLSNDAGINLSEIFYNPDNVSKVYKLSVEYASGDTTEQTDLSIGNNFFTWQSLSYLQYGITKITKILAYDNSNSEVPSATLNVDIERTDKDPFPTVLNLYQSIQDVGTSSYILDYQSAKGFNDSSITINNSDLQNMAYSRVTAAVYQNHYLKFDAGYGAVDWTTSMKVYAHDSNPAHLYLDDFNFNLVSTSQTKRFDAKPAIQFSQLYPINNYDYWNNFSSHISEYVTLNTPTKINIGFASGTMTATYQDDASEGTGEIVKIDPYNGTSVFYIPFKK
ncbi:hypothetical protein A8709_29510 [Paenibacillus pectinilyticus]|uniref:Uncharacterized protein n=1 Tax=Paenibacillus pectinilyticus TaxID=512399 RepID=A0A1C0ZV94_9BACL|nr:hypothetical protein [Paenibacillus pectinilyticus]OCT11997.1 hypothetical protein A8709_29510 [Paenibacillus pectinilyticus]